jgi:hypothetical protein
MRLVTDSINLKELLYTSSLANLVHTYLPSLSVTGSGVNVVFMHIFSAFPAASSDDNRKILSTKISEIFIIIVQDLLDYIIKPSAFFQIKQLY